MAEHPKGNDPKSLEMRVAELEDRLSKMHITEDEMKAYQKVSALVGGQAAGGGAGLQPFTCVVHPCVINPCVIRPCTIVNHCIQPCVIRQCITHCINECGGGCLPGGGGVGGGGFGGLGS
jgi:hypothetical protein